MTHDDTTHLLDAILELKTREELQRFFDDLCTIQEINSMAQRFEAGKEFPELLVANYDLSERKRAEPKQISLFDEIQ